MKAHLGHIQLAQLLLNEFFQCHRGLSPGSGELSPLRPCLFQGGRQLFLQPGQGIAGVLDLLQLRPAFGQIVQHVLHCGSVFFPQPVNHIQTALQLIQLSRFKIQAVPKIPHQLRDIIGGAAQLCEPLGQLGNLIADSLSASKGLLRRHDQSHSSLAFLVPGQSHVGPLHRVDELSRVPQHRPTLGELLLFPRLQVGPLQLADLEGQAVDAPGLFCLVHPQG